MTKTILWILWKIFLAACLIAFAIYLITAIVVLLVVWGFIDEQGLIVKFISNNPIWYLFASITTFLLRY